jgi:glycerol-3-phosphate O-acyltransferase
MSWIAALCARPLKWLVNHQSLPEDPVRDLGLDLSRPVVYVANTDSWTDRMVLAHCCDTLGLPSPLDDVQHGNDHCPSHVGLVARTDNPQAWAGRRVFDQLMAWHAQDPALDVQMVAVALLWGRSAGQEDGAAAVSLDPPKGLRKLLAVLFKGRENRVRFSPPVSLRVMADRHARDPQFVDKLVRVARQHFGRQQKAAQGPGLPNRDRLFEDILQSPAVRAQIGHEALLKALPEAKVEARARAMLDELAARFSYRLVRMADRVLTWFWNRLYRGITVQGAERVRRLTQQGHVIVYLPCHRSHMDYLLLSYVIYHQGLMPPHIAAGVNLNFWPAGPILRRGGAFFIRRSFKGDPLYSAVFREYLARLFVKGYPIKFFPEGTRSRTGRLLPPMTGLLAMMVSTLRKGLDRPVTVVPVYLGYEHVMEVRSYHRELSGGAKEKESVGQVLSMLRKLRNYGRGYVNFGEPLTLHRYLDEQQPDWRAEPDDERPDWLASRVDQLAQTLMQRINASAAVNGMSLAALALLASEQRALPRDVLLRQMDFSLDLLRAVPYGPELMLPTHKAAALLAQATELNKLKPHQDSFGSIVTVTPGRSLELTYYRNTLIHLFVLPSLLARLLLRWDGLSADQIQGHMARLYPLLQPELSLHFSAEGLHGHVGALLAHLEASGAAAPDGQGVWRASGAHAVELHLLGQVVQESLQRQAMAVSLLLAQPDIGAEAYARQAQELSQRLAMLHGVRAPEFFDARLAQGLADSLRALGPEIWPEVWATLSPLLNPSERLTLGSWRTPSDAHSHSMVAGGLLETS